VTPINRRSWFAASAAGAAALATGSIAEARPRVALSDAEAPFSRWRKAFMLGGVSKGAILPHFERLREAGFEGVELISPSELDRDEVLQARDKTGIIIHGVSGSQHWKDPLSSPDPAVRLRSAEAIRREIEDCKAYGGTTVLVVPAVVNRDVSNRMAWQNSKMMIQALIPDAAKAGIFLAIEEVWNKFLLNPTEFADYVDAFESPHVRAYFDVGNVVEYGVPQEWIRELGPRIAKVHIKEYAKSKRFDYKLGEGGEIDWPEVARALLSVGYEGWVTAEVPYGDVDQLKDVVRRMDKVLSIA
jgi:hexulose-6-phosphate isomerase